MSILLSYWVHQVLYLEPYNMSTLTINNVEKIIQTCNTYQFGYAGTNPGDTGIVNFVDCAGNNVQISLTW